VPLINGEVCEVDHPSLGLQVLEGWGADLQVFRVGGAGLSGVGRAAGYWVVSQFELLSLR
jgi:hypothetical protein